MLLRLMLIRTATNYCSRYAHLIFLDFSHLVEPGIAMIVGILAMLSTRTPPMSNVWLGFIGKLAEIWVE